jgi:polar amino acid transport system substrate-binding protein
MFDRRKLLGGAGTGLVALAAATVPARADEPGETTFNRIQRTKTLRIAGVVGAEPYFSKNIATGEWSGFAVAMANDIAGVFGAKLEIVETTWGNSVLDLQSNKVDVSFGLNPTPARAIVVDFTNPLFYTAFAIVGHGDFAAKTWAELNDPAVTIAVDIGSSHELIARQMAPNAKIVALGTPSDSVLAVQSGRANCFVMTVILALAAKSKNPSLGNFTIPTPVLSAPGCAALRNEPYNRMRDFMNSWAAYNRGMGRVRTWILAALAQQGITAKDIPPEVTF